MKKEGCHRKELLAVTALACAVMVILVVRFSLAEPARHAQYGRAPEEGVRVQLLRSRLAQLRRAKSGAGAGAAAASSPALAVAAGTTTGTATAAAMTAAAAAAAQWIEPDVGRSTGGGPPLVYLAGLGEAGQSTLYRAAASVAATVNQRLVCDAEIEKRVQKAAIAQGSQVEPAYDAIVARARELASGTARDASAIVLNGCSGSSSSSSSGSDSLHPARLSGGENSIGKYTIDHPDLGLLEERAAASGLRMAAVYVQRDAVLVDAHQGKPGKGKVMADNLRVLLTALLDLRGPLACVSVSQPTEKNATAVLRVLGLSAGGGGGGGGGGGSSSSNGDEAAANFVSRLRSSTARTTGLSAHPDNIPVWTRTSIPLTLQQLAQVCGGLPMPAFPDA